MRTSSFLVAALAAAVSLASAQERPKIYFPRHVKRMFVNATITSLVPHVPAQTPKAGTAPLTTKRETTLPDIFSSIADPVGDGTSQADPSSEGPLRVTSIITIVVPPAPTDTASSSTSSGVIPGFGAIPTPESKSSTSGGSGNSTSGDDLKGTSTTSGAIVLWPTGASTVNPLDPVGSVISSVGSGVGSVISSVGSGAGSVVSSVGSGAGSVVSSVGSGVGSVVSSVGTAIPTVSIPSQNATVGTGPLITLKPTTTPPVITISLSLPKPDPTSIPSLNVTVITTPPPLSLPTTTVLPPPPPPPTNITISLPPPSSTPANVTVSAPTVTPPPISSTATLPPVPPPVSTANNTLSINTTALAPTPTTTQPSTSLMTSVPIIGTITNSQSWLPTTILVQPTPTAPTPTGLAPTAPSGLPTGLPKVITPDNTTTSIPDDTMVVQIAFGWGLNYEFVAKTPQSAAQVMQTLPQILSYQAGVDKNMIKVLSLNPYDTTDQLHYITTLAHATYPVSMLNQLQLDVHIPNSLLFSNPDRLAYNMSLEINPAIGILLGSELEWNPTGSAGGTAATTTGSPDMFNNEGGQSQTPQQKGVTIGIAFGAVFVSLAYGGAMFIVARRYKRKKQSHHRSSSITSPSEMRQTGSPALMGGALLSRDFTSTYGGVAAGGRDSHGSGRSGMNNSGRTAFISAPVAQENSLGWN